MLLNLFITFAYLQFENFRWPTSKSPAYSPIIETPLIFYGFSDDLQKKGGHRAPKTLTFLQASGEHCNANNQNAF